MIDSRVTFYPNDAAQEADIRRQLSRVLQPFGLEGRFYSKNTDFTSLNKTCCCGVREIDMLSKSVTPFDAMKQIARDIITTVEKGPFITFTGTVITPNHCHGAKRDNNYGQDFADYIEANGLGTVIAIPPQVSWTRNTVGLWVWTVNYDGVRAWIKKLEAPAEVVAEVAL